MIMQDMGSIWSSHQEGIDELKQKLMYTSLELEIAKTEANDEIKKSKEKVTALLNLLQLAYQERDEAREQLKKLLYTDQSNSQSHNSSSPVSSFFDPNVVSSSDLSNNNMGSFVNQEKPFMVNHNVCPKVDPFDHLVRGKVLPEKGRLLQAVMEAGPLLSNLLLAGPLPLWRNPPPLQAFKIPPVSINASAMMNSSSGAVRQFNSSSSSQLNSSAAPVLNFRTGPCLNNGRLLNSGVSMSNQIPLTKGQRFF